MHSLSYGDAVSISFGFIVSRCRHKAQPKMTGFTQTGIQEDNQEKVMQEWKGGRGGVR
jgi:hypothetical protein